MLEAGRKPTYAPIREDTENNTTILKLLHEMHIEICLLNKRMTQMQNSNHTAKW